MTETQDREHVTFRPGDLLERLRVSRLTLGATAKRDLARYYRLIDAEFEAWSKDRGVTDQTWAAIGAFVCTRSWPTPPGPPTPIGFFAEAQSFFASSWGYAFGEEKDTALRALRGLSAAQVVGIIDAAESELAPPPLVAVATRGATSADGSDPLP
jgi:hypothetical protein